MKRILSALIAIVFLFGMVGVSDAGDRKEKDNIKYSGRHEITGTLDLGCATTQYLISDGTDLACQTISGDITSTNAGVTTIGANKVTSAKILDGEIVNADINAAAAIALTKFADAAGDAYFITSTGTDGHTQVAISGMLGITNAGVASPTTEDTTTENVLTASECGKTVFLNNAATEFDTTLPAEGTVSAGCFFDVYVDAAPSGASYIVNTTALTDTFYGSISNAAGVEATAGEDTLTITDGQALEGDYVRFFFNGTRWMITGRCAQNTGFVFSGT